MPRGWEAYERMRLVLNVIWFLSASVLAIGCMSRIAIARRTRKGVARQPLPMVMGGFYSGAVRCARTRRTSWSLCVAGTTSAEGERSARLP